jgi:hypothetical protein
MNTFSGSFGDARIDQRAASLFHDLRETQAVSIRRIADSRAKQIAYYRLLDNEALTDDALRTALTTRTAHHARDAAHVLCIQDTTQFNFQAHAGRLGADSGFGVIGDNASLGFFLHPTLAMDADTGHALGFSHVAMWTRPAQRADATTRKRLPLEDKESFRWIESIKHSRAALPGSVRLTAVADREGDIYDLFARLPPASHAIVRMCRNRQLPEGKLFAVLAAAPVAGTAVVRLRGDLRRGTTARTAELHYRYRRLTVPRSSACRDAAVPAEVTLWGIEVRESAESAGATPAGATPVHWRLLTTHQVETYADASRVVSWYQQRWHVEQLFRLMKTDGFALESSELEQSASVLRLTYLVLGAALEVLRLMLAERGESTEPLGQVFDEAEQACLSSLNRRLGSGSASQSNPHAEGTLGWAGWVIARLGGWKGLRSERRAGPVVYCRGLTRFRSLFHGWLLAQGDVCTP